MNTKKAINILEFYKIDPPKHCERNEELQEIIELLQRGEKYEAIWRDVKQLFSVYADSNLKYIEEKYFPKENNNDKELIKRIRKIIEVINERGITLEEFNKVFTPKC